MYILKELVEKTIEAGASDLHLSVGIPPTIRINGRLQHIGNENLNDAMVEDLAKEILKNRYDEYKKIGEYDLAYQEEGIGRFRVNVFRQKGHDAVALRVIPLKVPTLDDLKHPRIFKDLIKKRRGLVLVTGPTGSGKSTTLAAMINEINNSKDCHIVTLEDPIEYLHEHKLSMVNQREIGQDTKNFASALRAALREDPDVILVGEMRDPETIAIAITAAETGHLVFSTLHTIGASKTIDRIIDVFEPHQQQQIRTQLASVLQGIISQQLIEKIDGSGRVAALEIMTITPGIQNLIREGKSHQIESSIQTGAKYGMKTMDMALAELYKSMIISKESAFDYCVDQEILGRMIGM